MGKDPTFLLPCRPPHCCFTLPFAVTAPAPSPAAASTGVQGRTASPSETPRQRPRRHRCLFAVPKPVGEHIILKGSASHDATLLPAARPSSRFSVPSCQWTAHAHTLRPWCHRARTPCRLGACQARPPRTYRLAPPRSRLASLTTHACTHPAPARHGEHLGTRTPAAVLARQHSHARRTHAPNHYHGRTPPQAPTLFPGHLACMPGSAQDRLASAALGPIRPSQRMGSLTPCCWAGSRWSKPIRPLLFPFSDFFRKPLQLSKFATNSS